MAWADLTLEDIRLEIREILGEADDESDPLWSNAYINKWINRFARVVVEATEAIDEYNTFNTADGTVNYDMPGKIFKPMLLKRGTSTIRKIDIWDLRKIDITTTGTPTRFLIFNKQMYLYNVPSSIEAISVWGHAYPPHLSGDDITLTGVDRELIEVIEKLVIARCQEKDMEYGVANQYYSQVPFNISDYLFKNVTKQGQANPDVQDVMGYRTKGVYE